MGLYVAVVSPSCSFHTRTSKNEVKERRLPMRTPHLEFQFRMYNNGTCSTRMVAR